jgi:membrane-bound metal-dependent hydrolase YbcI (DUF457 family)
MDTITHGLAGALIGKAFFAGAGGSSSTVGAGLAPPGAQHPSTSLATRAAPLQPTFETTANRVAVLAATLGAVFPDFDIVTELFNSHDVAMIELHRGFTHSFVCLPVFALALAGLTRWFCRWRGIACPSWSRLALIYAISLAIHIVLDLTTSFGTLIWSPVSNARAAWDMTFILDFLLTATLLVPQMAAWVYRARRGYVTRAIFSWTMLSLALVVAERLARAAGFGFTPWAVVVLSVLFALVFFLPARRNRGFAVSRARWCRAGVAVVVAYLGFSAAAHYVVRQRVEGFAEGRGLTVEHLAALPLPPSPLSWSGMIRTPEGVYQARFRLFDRAPAQFQFFADSPPNAYIAAAKALPSVKTYLWFARFLVVHYEEQGDLRIVEFADLRFFTRPGRRHPFAFRVTFNGAGQVVEQRFSEN